MLDAFVRRMTYPAIVLFAIGVIAYLNASALTTLVVDAYLGAPATPAPCPARKRVIYAAEEPRDRLETINGFDVASPESALEAYARVRTADDLVVRVTRQGRPTTIVLKIR